MLSSAHRYPSSVLVADDDKELCTTLGDVLESRGIKPLLAHRGDEAIRLARKHPVPLSIFDIHLPDMTGFDVYRTIKEFQRELKCIFITGNPTNRIRHEALSLGAYSFFIKPMDNHDFLEAVFRALKTNRE